MFQTISGRPRKRLQDSLGGGGGEWFKQKSGVNGGKTCGIVWPELSILSAGNIESVLKQCFKWSAEDQERGCKIACMGGGGGGNDVLLFLMGLMGGKNAWNCLAWIVHPASL